MKLKRAEYQSDIESSYDIEEKKKQRRENAKIQFSDKNDNKEQNREKIKRVKPKKINLPSLSQAPQNTVSNIIPNTSKILSCSTVNIKSLSSTNQKRYVAISPQLSDESDNEEQICGKERRMKQKNEFTVTFSNSRYCHDM